MSGRVRIGALATAAALAAIAPGAGAAPHGPPRIDARVMGTFAMKAHVTVAVNVRGEAVGEVFRRRWKIVPARCRGSVCQLLRLNRVRSAGRHDRLVLHRVGRGRYVGRGSFWVALECRGRVYPHGSEVPFEITLQVRSVARVEGIAFARQIFAVYDNPSRSDTTPCPLGPSRDAGWYYGHATSGVPAAPSASFTTALDPAHDSASFRDTSRRGAGGARLVSRRWGFGDPASGSANASRARAPSHTFTAPGTYTVSLTVVDSNGLSATATHQVLAPGPPTAAFTVHQEGTTSTFDFQDSSRPGVGDAPIVGWQWDFGDPASGSANTSTAESPSHTFSAHGAYTVTLTATDANGRSSRATQAVSY